MQYNQQHKAPQSHLKIASLYYALREERRQPAGW